MNVRAMSSSEALLATLRDPQAWAKTSDIFAALIALALPWSTTLVGVFVVIWLIALIPTIDPKALLALLRRPICIFPMALFALALVGTLWSDAVWGERFHTIGQATKLLALPLLLYHYQRSTRGMWVFVAFLVSCSVLMVISWIVAFDPALAFKAHADRGIFVKNYIDQSQEFVLCAVVLAFPVVTLVRANRIVPASLLGALALSFVANMAFVIVSRTALVTMPIMLVVFALIHLKWRSIAIIGCAIAILAGVAWATSPQLRKTVGSISQQYSEYKEKGAVTSVGERLEFWRKSLLFFSDAPLIGHGTGSTRGLFEQAAVGQTGLSAEVIGNPHNQTLNVAVQWGVVGVVLLYAMWLTHLSLFRGDDLAAWIGLMAVVQNIFTSLFNSHIFDFNEGWMYVLGVGVAGGMLLKAFPREAAPERLNPGKS
jgi:hypothetical protein